jgi:hypothetical protein
MQGYIHKVRLFLRPVNPHGAADRCHSPQIFAKGTRRLAVTQVVDEATECSASGVARAARGLRPPEPPRSGRPEGAKGLSPGFQPWEHNKQFALKGRGTIAAHKSECAIEKSFSPSILRFEVGLLR